MTERELRVFIDGESFETSDGEFIDPERVAVVPKFIMHPPGASDEVHEAVDKVINQTWGEK